MRDLRRSRLSMLLTAMFLPCIALTTLRRDAALADPVADAAAKTDAIRLAVARASATRHDDYVDFQCMAVLVNETDAAIQVKSNFGSAFDGLQLVVYAADGTKLAQQPYVLHQSPLAPPGRRFAFQPGKNRQTFRFPVASIPRDVDEVRLALVGTLDSAQHKPLLCSNLVTIAVDNDVTDGKQPEIDQLDDGLSLPRSIE